LTFSEHLKARSSNIKNAIRDLFGRLPAASPDVEELRRQLADLLAKEKEHSVALRKALDEKESMYERLEQAMGRYMTAERKLDRAKSTQVLKLEKQAMMSGSADATSPVKSRKDHTETNGELENGIGSAEIEALRREAVAAAEKRKAQVLEVEAENDRLTNELSAARTKLASLTDDDYAETHLFKTLRSKYDDVVKMTNNLEATNAKLVQEAQRIQAERTSYRAQIDEEARLQTNEAEAASARAETDVARIRDHRDQLSTELAIAKSAKDSHALTLEQAKSLAEANTSRISSLESEVHRLKLQVGEAQAETGNFEELGIDALRDRLRERESQYALLSNELPSMEAAWKKTQALASRKMQEIATWEEQIARLNAEKAKADQKYFAAMKAKDMREAELKTLKSQAARSSEIVTQLKDGEAKARELLVNLERQLADSRDATTKLEQQQRSNEQKFKESTLQVDGLKKNVEDLKLLISAKDKENLELAKSKREMEENLEKTKVRLEESKKQHETLRKSRVAVSSADSDDWRKVAICPVCNANIRNTVLKLCGHVFCSSCVKDLISNRSRKCPSCGRGFGTNDQMGIVLT
jgi:E3 ubiquitin-protein ligase BRE1